MTVLTKLHRDRRGGIALTAAFAMTAIIGFAALAIDVGVWYSHKARLQAATDAAAYAGLHELARPASTDDVVLAAVRRMAADNGFSQASGAQIDAAVIKSRTAVQVSIAQPGPLLFAAVVKAAAPNLMTHAVAEMVGQNPPCVLALEPSAANAIHLEGSPTITAPTCKIQVNSTSGDAVNLVGAPHLTAGEICIAGGATGRTGNMSPAPATGCAAMPDPLAGVPGLGALTCDVTAPYAAGPSAPLEPGRVYCGLVTLTGNLTLAPGVYLFKDGGLDVGNHSLHGDGVTLYLAGTATFTATGNGTMFLKAPRTGPFAGIVIYQDRSAPLGLVSEISGNANKHYEGTVYLPNARMHFRGAGSGNTSSPYSIFIARRFSFEGSGDLQIGTNYAASDVKPPANLGKRLTLTQ